MELERGEQRSLSAASGIRKLFPTARWKGRKTTPSASSPTTQSLHRGHVLEFTDLQNLGRAIVCEGGLSGFKAELNGSLLIREEKPPALSTGCSNSASRRRNDLYFPSRSEISAARLHGPPVSDLILLATICASSGPRRAAHESIGKRTTTLVPLPAVLRMSSSAPRFFARARILANPNPSPLDRPLAMPEPLSLIVSTRFGGSHRRLTLITVGWAWRSALLIAS